MGVVAFLIIGFVIFALIKSGVTGTAYDRLAKNGKPARGILLQVAQTGSRMARTPVAIETRAVTVDVEIPGQEPYEVSCLASFPANLRGDVLPGATVELRVDPKNKQLVAIVGPGATFAAALLLQGRTS